MDIMELMRSPRIMQVSKAAQLAGINQDELLDYAAAGRIHLCVKKPEEIRVFSAMPSVIDEIKSGRLEPRYPSEGASLEARFDGSLYEATDVEYLLLSPKDCAAIVLQPITQGVFAFGYKIGNLSILRLTPRHQALNFVAYFEVRPVYTTHAASQVREGKIKLPINDGRDVMPVTAISVADAHHSYKGILIHRDDLYIVSKELGVLLQTLQVPEATTAVHDPLDPKGSGRGETRRNVLKLCLQAVEFLEKRAAAGGEEIDRTKVPGTKRQFAAFFWAWAKRNGHSDLRDMTPTTIIDHITDKGSLLKGGKKALLWGRGAKETPFYKEWVPELMEDAESYLRKYPSKKGNNMG